MQQSIDTGDAAAQAVAPGEFLAQAGAGKHGVLPAKFADDGMNRGVG